MAKRRALPRSELEVAKIVWEMGEATVRQVLYLVEVEQKRDLLNHLLQSSNMRHVLVFTRTSPSDPYCLSR